jgi:cellulose biosynthesis protein BcsQ
MILRIGGEKGGTGTTAAATNLAALRAAASAHVLLVDTDRQGSAVAQRSSAASGTWRPAPPT